ncbi:MAG: Xaa-Pro dipeptidase [Gammaproteobacteria bacterium]|nr:MAG: Xaa-Pro dipeptidase [Gammaproteobacteria bacterium]
MEKDGLLERLYADHHAYLVTHYESLLEEAGWDGVVLASGSPCAVFGDDQFHPFRVSPGYRQWIPCGDHTSSYLVIRPGHRPRLICHQPEDYWHVSPTPPSGIWTDHFDVDCVSTSVAAAEALPGSLSRWAFLGEPSADVQSRGFGGINPDALVSALDFHRTVKTPYEVECMRRANRIAVAGHRAALQSFRAGEAELDAHLAYMAAVRQSETRLPYPNIVAFNEHGATLHYDVYDTQAPPESLSFLIDAGADYLGYAADITRTYAAADGLFSELTEQLDEAQHSLIASIEVGMSYIDLHAAMHLSIAELLKRFLIVDMTPEAMLESGVTSVFFPHGLGHHIGLQVHDVGGKNSDPKGTVIDQPPSFPFLRNLRPVSVGNVFTIEPGVYFIRQLLEPLRSKAEGRAVDWGLVSNLMPYGGIRIEDDVHVSEAGPENLTRDAFAALL